MSLEANNLDEGLAALYLITIVLSEQFRGKMNLDFADPQFNVLDQV